MSATQENKIEEYWFTVGSITGLFVFIIIVFPCMVMAGITRELPTATTKIIFGIVPMLVYLILLRLRVHWLVKFCRKLAVQAVKEEIPEAWKT